MSAKESKKDIVMDHGCRKCRRQGVKLFLKGEKCFSPKCPITSRPYPPGQHGPTKFSKLSEYGKQLKEKQKVRNIYNINETQLKNYYTKASKMAGNTSENLVQLLESRLDSVIYSIGLFKSRSAARQAVNHGFFLLSDKKADIPSILVKNDDLISLKPGKNIKSEDITRIPNWLESSKKNKGYKVKKLPTLDDVDMPYDINLVIEYYSR
jgi:small subunit ribosomal protein S4